MSTTSDPLAADERTILECGLSVILIPVPEATPLVHEYRLQLDPAARAGVPEHITLLHSFLEPHELSSDILGALASLFQDVAPFPFTLRHTGWFEPDILFLAPDPPESFVAITHQLSNRFGVLPYEGRYATVHPHLTVAMHGERKMLQGIESEIAAHLPLRATASEAQLMTGNNEVGWTLHGRFPFHGVHGRPPGDALYIASRT